MYIAFVPIRSGSKGIPHKNIRNFNGKPLSWWVLNELNESPTIQRIIIAIDAEYLTIFLQMVQHDFSETGKFEIYIRSDKSARNESVTEDVLLEYINEVYSQPEISNDRIMLTQVTNPFLTTKYIEQAVELYEMQHNLKSVVSCAPLKKFIWKRESDGGSYPINYDFHERPLRQWWEGKDYVVENGALYLSSVGNIWKTKNRLTYPVGSILMPEYSSLEIDTEDDWQRVEKIFREKHLYE